MLLANSKRAEFTSLLSQNGESIKSALENTSDSSGPRKNLSCSCIVVVVFTTCYSPYKSKAGQTAILVITLTYGEALVYVSCSENTATIVFNSPSS